MPTKNGHSTNGLTPFTCKDTEIELKIRKIPLTLTSRLIVQYEKDNPPPQPPTEEVDYGDGEKIREPNIAHPTYIHLLNRYQRERNIAIEEKIRHLFAELAIECEIDKERVKHLREAMQVQGVTLDDDDKYVYIWNIAIGTQEGYAELMNAIQMRIQPMPEVIAQAKESFRSEVQEAGHLAIPR